MKRRPGNSLVICTAVAGALAMAVPAALSCGNFRKPVTHFDGVNEYGFVSYWDQLGELSLSDGSVLPLIVGFRSDWEALSSSPHLGNGWLFGLLDAHFVQRSENTFDMISIDGYTVPFGRDSKSPSILNGAQDWKAEIRGETITVWASCGWKLQFVKGKISSITTPKSLVVQIRRNVDGTVNDVVEGANSLLKLARDSRGELKTLVLNNKQSIHLQHVDKPVMQSINGVNVVGGTRRAVGEIELPDGTPKEFSYSPNANLQSTLSISGEGQNTRTLAWNPGNRIIASDGGWNYNVLPSDKPGHNAAIERTDAEGHKEFWHYDMAKGSETTIGPAGIKTTKTWFTSGDLNGKVRKITQSVGGRQNTISEYSYNENAGLLRETNNGMSVWYADDISTLSNQLTDKTTIAIQKTKGGEIEKVASSWFTTYFEKQKDFEAIVTKTENGTLTRIVDKQGRLIKIVATSQP